MVKVSAPRFDLDECRDATERDFVEALHTRAEAGAWWADAWLRDDRIILTIDICDSDLEYNCVLRMLRVDFDGAMLTLGADETYQLVTDLDPKRTDVISMRDQSPAILANAAADWLERELGREIERHEWNRPTFSHRLWVYADTGEGLVMSDSENKRRTDLGPPDRVVVLRGSVVDRPEAHGG